VDIPYNQGYDEWVLLVSDSADLWIEGEGERELRPGDYVLIPSHRRDRVSWTAKGEPTVWLAVHFS
jgi:cupin 2 domain-containing protein